VAQEIERLWDALERAPDLGYPLRGEWEGCYCVHLGHDRFRVIWEILDPEPDYDGPEGAEVIPVVVLRIGPKTQRGGETIYEQTRPTRED
jgi:hypothetical protein